MVLIRFGISVSQSSTLGFRKNTASSSCSLGEAHSEWLGRNFMEYYENEGLLGKEDPRDVQACLCLKSTALNNSTYRRNSTCVLAFDVVSFSQDQFRLVHVEVEVRDVNDHAPRFPRTQIPVEVSEGAAVGTRIPLEVPVDEDVGANGLQSVRLAEPHSPFRVELQTRADGAQCADLVLLQELDRESQAAYNLELVAQDGGRPPSSATTALSVSVLDANDHSPAFPQGAVAEVELAEDAPVGSLLLDLDAADPDEGPNGKVVFAFGARTPQEARRFFRLDPRSGRLTLAGPVDYERQDTYELDVRAQDRGPGSRATTCKVIVRIRDVNDNAPDIAITPLASWVSLLQDLGANGQMRGALYGHEHFRLQPAYAGSYLVVTAASLDRERIAEYNLTLVAEDRGAPPLRTVRPYTVRVSDENDNAPLLTRPVYEVSVRENNPPGAYLATVTARDPDLGRNGQVTYRLLEAEGSVSGPFHSLFLCGEDKSAASLSHGDGPLGFPFKKKLPLSCKGGGYYRLACSTSVATQVPCPEEEGTLTITFSKLPCSWGSACVGVPPIKYIHVRLSFEMHLFYCH
ncbi:Protocadherin-8 [Manis javanica]|nr:Protocadherin-8 [Manis javanica]